MKILPITTGELLRMAEQQGNVSKVERTWRFMEDIEGEIALVPTPGIQIQLFRGQTKRYTPCFPSIARHINRPIRSFYELNRGECTKLIANLIRSYWYCDELDRHPVFSHWSGTQGAIVQKTRIELAQYYGVPSSLIDLTESLEVALFFATHEFRDGIPYACKEGKGILYRTVWPNFNEPLWRFKSLAIGPFARSFRQFAWSCELTIGECFERCPGLVAFEFDHDEKFGNAIRTRAEGNGPLFPNDPMAEIAEFVKESKIFPRKIAERVVDFLIAEPAGLPYESQKNIFSVLESAGFFFLDSLPPLINDDLKARLLSIWELERVHWDAIFVKGYAQRLTRSIEKNEV